MGALSRFRRILVRGAADQRAGPKNRVGHLVYLVTDRFCGGHSLGIREEIGLLLAGMLSVGMLLWRDRISMHTSPVNV